MPSAHQLIAILSDGKFHSGTELGTTLGVSRAAIGKYIQKLKLDFKLNIFSVKGKGYCLSNMMYLLDKERIFSFLEPSMTEEINEFEIFLNIDSTNAYLNQKSLDGASSGYVVLAESQSNGVGRRGKKWVTVFGSSIALSLLWRFDGGPAQLCCLSLYIAVSILRTLKYYGIHDAGVKWPNDIIWSNKKLAGVLLEMRGEISGPSAVVIGIGINLFTSKDTDEINGIIDQPFVDVETILGRKLDRNEFTAHLISNLVEVLIEMESSGISLDELNRTENKLLDEWRRADILFDKPIRVELHGEIKIGKSAGITDQGALRLLSNGKEMVCHSGEVSVRKIIN